MDPPHLAGEPHCTPSHSTRPSALYFPQPLSPQLCPLSQTLSSWLQLRSCSASDPCPGPPWPERVFLYSELPLTGYRSWILDSNFLLLPDQCINWGMLPELWSWGPLWDYWVDSDCGLSSSHQLWYQGFWSIERAGNYCRTPSFLFFQQWLFKGMSWAKGIQEEICLRPLGKLSFLN